jgi:hypothetical protein
MINSIAAIVINSPLPKTSSGLVSNVLYIAFGTLGGICLIVIAWAGMKYTLSGGDPAKTSEAKNQIMYAAIGMAVAIAASAIVTFASGRISG